jgi:hypothetical protein
MHILNNIGGGIEYDNSSSKLKNVTFKGNEALDWEYWYYSAGRGGGIRSTKSNIKLDNVIFTENKAHYGGAISCIESNLNLNRVTIRNNKASFGGGICFNYSENDTELDFSLSSVSISGNEACFGGGIYFSAPYAEINFNEVNRSNIYLNHADSVGHDLYNGNSNIISVILDTFTVLTPTNDYASPLEKFTFDILHAKVTAIRNEEYVKPYKYALKQNYPNPFNPSTTIEFDLPKYSEVNIVIYNIAGQKVQTLLNKKMAAGSHQLKFNAQNLSSGVYFYRIEVADPARRTDEFQDVKKMIVIR